MQLFWTVLHPVSQQASSKEVGYKKTKTKNHEVMITIKNC